MIIEDVQNAKSEAPGTWRDQKTIQPRIDSQWGGGTRQASGTIGCESISNDRDDWTWGNISDQCGQGTPGGIVDRLISKTVDLIKESESRTADLKQYLTELKELSTQIRQKEGNEE